MQKYLHEMGIDVWVLRAESNPAERQSGLEATNQKAVVRIGPENKPQVELGPMHESRPVEFLFCFLDYQNLSLVMSLPYEASSLPPEYRNFADDIHFAICEQRSIPGLRELRWPIVRSANMKQTAEDARQVVSQKVRQCRDRLIVFGQQALGFIIDPVEDSPRAGEKLKIGDKSLLVARDVRHYFDNPGDKKQLWQQVWRPGKEYGDE